MDTQKLIERFLRDSSRVSIPTNLRELQERGRRIERDWKDVIGAIPQKRFEFLVPETALNITVFPENHKLEFVNDIKMYDPSGNEVEVFTNVQEGTVYIESNIDLFNHNLIIF